MLIIRFLLIRAMLNITGCTTDFPFFAIRPITNTVSANGPGEGRKPVRYFEAL